MPSKMKIQRQPSRFPTPSIFAIAKARSPLNAPAIEAAEKNRA